ncbi:MAG: protein kinase [Deltaproteobacteria bacterium]|nr:protein kinase [Deltaproteobacteria bacterium]
MKLSRPLGEGAMGKVWVADHLTLGTEVAVKFISAELAAQHPDIVKRFEREASVAARIKSPHVVQTFDRGVTDDGTPFIVMELLEGQSLWDMLEAGPLALRDTADIVLQVARALRRAHELGIVHRDIKPENVFVSKSDDGVFCKVLDFGIAKQASLPVLEGLTSPGTLIGTPEFMSPELFTSAAEADERADLWALAVTAYQCLTGEYPFPGKTLGVLCAQLLRGEFEPPSRHRAELGAAVDAWFARAFARDPADRFASARELAHTFALLADPHGGGFEDTLAESRRASREQTPRTKVGLGPSTLPSSCIAAPTSLDDPPAPGTLAGASSDVGLTPPRSGRARTTRVVLGAVIAASALAALVVVGRAGRAREDSASARSGLSLSSPTSASVEAPRAAESEAAPTSTLSATEVAASSSPAASTASERAPLPPVASAAQPATLPAVTAPSARPSPVTAPAGTPRPASAQPTRGNYGF